MTDHQPHIGICNGKNLDAVNNVRIQRILSKTLGYGFCVLYMSGKLNLITDALSRLPVFAAEKDDPDLICTVRATKLDKIDRVSNCTSDVALNEIIEVLGGQHGLSTELQSLSTTQATKECPTRPPSPEIILNMGHPLD